MLSTFRMQNSILLKKRLPTNCCGSAYATAATLKIDQPEQTSSTKLELQWAQAKPFKQLPGLTKFQLLRGFMRGGDFYKMPFNDLMLMCRKRYGDTYLLPGLFGQKGFVVLFSPDDFEKVFRTEGTYPDRPGQEAVLYYRRTRADKFFDEWQGLAAKGESWGKFRHAVNPVLMQPRNAKLYLEPLQAISEEFIQRIRDIRDPITMEVPGNFLTDINHLTFEAVTVVGFDKRLGLLRRNTALPEAEQLFKSLQIFLKSLYELGVKPTLYKFIPTPEYLRFKKAMDTIFDISTKYINEALARIETQQEHVVGRSVLEQLIKVDRNIAKIMAMDMLLAGVDTSATIITGILLCIAKNPAKQAKLREEIRAVVPHANDKFTIENTKELPYLRACIKEAMRIYPIIFGNIRATGRDLPLGGYRIPKGTQVFMNSNLLLREERYYPRPLEFIPERWLRANKPNDENLTVDNLSPFIYLPFGFGARTCIGKRIVEMEMELALANIVRNFQIEFNYPTENAFRNHFINTPAIPLKFKFTDLRK